MNRLISLFTVALMGCSNYSPQERLLAEAETLATKDYTAKHTEALAYCKEKKLNQDYYFLIDLSEHSGKNRFFVYDFKENKVTDQNLVTHGSCDIPNNYSDKWEKARFSNKDGSHCSSLGTYKIGARDTSSWGIKIKYWLHGLEETNSNAIGRVVVLHSWDAVPDTEVYPDYSPLSWGCPAVSDNFMRKLDTKLQAVKKPVLLWVVE
jgi:hypothetical protein